MPSKDDMPAELLRRRTAPGPGLLMINADDWGRDRETTERTYECIVKGSVTSVSAMVFMSDSGRAAEFALKEGVDAGLHLNFTTPFSASTCSVRLLQHQERVSRYLRSFRFARVVFHPGLRQSFDYLVNAQIQEFCRLYGATPSRLDGHHHMHLCANVLCGSLLPAGAAVRRNFSFQSGEKGRINRRYREAVDHLLERRYILTDHFFSLPPLEPRSRIAGIFDLARHSRVEVETHPVIQEEYRFLMGPEMRNLMEKLSPGLRLSASH